MVALEGRKNRMTVLSSRIVGGSDHGLIVFAPQGSQVRTPHFRHCYFLAVPVFQEFDFTAVGHLSTSHGHGLDDVTGYFLPSSC